METNIHGEGPDNYKHGGSGLCYMIEVWFSERIKCGGKGWREKKLDEVRK